MIDKVYKFPEIEQFKNAIFNVRYKARYAGRDEDDNPILDETKELPTLTYRGSVKLHGTNAGLVFEYDVEAGEYVMRAQSRENIITPTKDNAGFAAFAHTTNVYELLDQLPPLAQFSEEEHPIIKIYGEWCGGSIQKGVALNQLEKMLVIIGIKIGNTWLNDIYLQSVKLPLSKIYNILDYTVFQMEIDFNNPKIASGKMSDLVDFVENECPVGKSFGVSGIGEGIVWVCTTKGWTNSRYWFKTKGEKHSDTKKDKKNKIPVDTEKIAKQQELVEFLLTDHRLSKGIDYLNENHLELTRKSLGPFLKWVFNDVVKEELDTIVKNGFEPKGISGVISNYARKWFFKYETELLDL